tara:strand:+ start:54535 stop:55194 length:660 start_codon:yes stop_codon:yes gene_type:complete
MIISLLSALLLQSAAPLPEPELVPDSALTGEAQPAFDRAAAIADINAYLNGITTLRARFVQVAPNGSAARGLLSMSRPGRLLFEYDDPSPIRVIADGTTVGLEDRDLETVDRAPLRSTPLWWLLKSDIDIAQDAEIVDINEEHGFLSIIVRDPNGEMEGEIEFLFDAENHELQQWFVTDALGEVTRVTLLDVETGMALSPRLFVIPDPDADRSSRRGRR